MRTRPIAILLAALLAVLSLLSCGEEPPATSASSDLPEPTELTLKLLSTGNSDAILLFADGYTILCDTADRDDYTAISQCLNEAGVSRIDCMILTHYDKDHIGSAASLLRDYKVTEILGPNYHSTVNEYEELNTYAASREIPWRRIKEDETLTFGALCIDILAPDKRTYADENNYSLILSLRYGSSSLLLCGDAMKERLNEAIPSLARHYDFIKLPHHGEHNKAVESLIKNCTPDYAVSCVAYASEVEAKLTSLLARNKVTAFVSCDGDLTVVTDGTTLMAVQDT